MSRTDHIKVISQVKLHELEVQRTRLHAHYDAVIARSADTETPQERLRILCDGVRDPLVAASHPDVSCNFETLFFEAECGSMPTDVIESWIAKLKEEIAQGQTRAEYAFLFGKLLEEWAFVEETRGMNADRGEEGGESSGVSSADVELADDAVDLREFRAAVTLLSVPVADEEIDLTFFDTLVAAHAESVKNVRKSIDEFCENWGKVTQGEVKSAIDAVCRDNLVTKAQQKELLSVSGSDRFLNEYAGVLTLLIKRFDEWEWPCREEGAPMRLLCNRSFKWRAFIDEDILSALFLQVVGVRWAVKVKEILRQFWRNTFPRLQLPWNATNSVRRHAHEGQLFLATLPDRIEDAPSTSSYDSPGNESHGTSKKQRVLQCVASEIALAQSLFPQEDFVAVGLDIQNFYPSLSHKLILHLLDQFLGVPEKWKGFFQRFLTPHVKIQGQTKVIRRGVLLGHALSKLIAEVLLFLAEVAIFDKTSKFITRVVDDIYITGPQTDVAVIFQTLQAFLKASGLQINQSKSGSVVVNASGSPGKPSALLPSGAVCWGLLALDSSGEWRIDRERLNSVTNGLRKRLIKCSATLSVVTIYNEYLRYLEKMFGQPCRALGEKHFNDLSDCFSKIHTSLFGHHHGIVEYLRERISNAFPRGPKDIPEAWVYWPITAGGMGLRNILLALAARGASMTTESWKRKLELAPLDPAAQSEEKQEFIPVNWESSEDSRILRVNSELRRLYEGNDVDMKTPVSTPNLRGLLSDFTERFQSVKGSKSRAMKKGKGTTANIGVYWKWLIQAYHRQVLFKFGSFAFFNPEMVPYHLILKVRSTQDEVIHV